MNTQRCLRLGGVRYPQVLGCVVTGEAGKAPVVEVHDDWTITYRRSWRRVCLGDPQADETQVDKAEVEAHRTLFSHFPSHVLYL